MQYADAIASIALQNSLAGLVLMGLGALLLLVMWVAK